MLTTLYTCLARPRLPVCLLCQNLHSTPLNPLKQAIPRIHHPSAAYTAHLRTLYTLQRSTWTSGVLLGQISGGMQHFTSSRGVIEFSRGMSSGRHQRQQQRYERRDRTVLIYICAVGVFMLGVAYAGVPLYRMFCQATGAGGQATQGHDTSKVETMTALKDRVLKIRFNADTASSMQWNFKPMQSEIQVLPGETALAFYTAKNPTDKAIIGISTYNVIPFEAGQYFNKIQCFCFEEQRLNPHEEVDMPVFFYIDPDFVADPKLELLDTITLSYTFFEAKEGMALPLPGYASKHS